MELPANVKKLPKLEKSTLTMGLIGYILRILPIAEIIGFLLTGILWYNIYKMWRKTYFLIVFIILLIAGISLIGSNVYSIVTIRMELSVPTNMSTDPLLILNTTYNKMVSSTSIVNNINNVVQIIAILLEGIGFLLLYRQFSHIFRPYVFILLIMLSLAMVFSIIATYISLANLKTLITETKRIIEEGEKIDPIVIEMNLVTALIPIIIAGLLTFILKIISYILCAITINRYKKAIIEEKILEELPPHPSTI